MHWIWDDYSHHGTMHLVGYLLSHIQSTLAVMLLSVGCQWNWPAEREVVMGWILADDQPVKNSERCLGYACTIIWYLNHIQPPKWNVWNKFLTTLSISAILASKVIEINLCLSTCLMCSVSVYCVCHLVNTKLEAPHSRFYWRLFQVSCKKEWLA